MHDCVWCVSVSAADVKSRDDDSAANTDKHDMMHSCMVSLKPPHIKVNIFIHVNMITPLI